MTTERLLEFLILSKTLNFSKAANQLFMSQSTLSKHIAALEDELGVKVLTRSTHSVSLTKAGRLLAQKSARLLLQCDSAVNQIALSDVQTSGEVSICCVENAVYDQLSLFLSRFGAKFQDADVRVDVRSECPLESLGDYDFVLSPFRYSHLPDEYVFDRAFDYPCIVIALSGNRLISMQSVGLQELAGETLFVPDYSEPSSFTDNAALAKDLTGGNITIVKVPSVESALIMTSLGKGVSIMPNDIRQLSPAPTLPIAISTNDCRFQTYLYYKSNMINPVARLMHSEFESFIRLS